MEYSVTDYSVISSDGVHALAGKLYIPKGKILGIFHLVHGMTEHILRYDPLFCQMAENGFLCLAYDNLGHGKTAADNSELGFIASKDGYKYLIDDVIRFSDSVRADYPGLPYFLMGHSMGSFIVRLVAEKYGNKIDGLIICGTGGPNPASRLGLALTKLLIRTRGERYISPMIFEMAFGNYNKHFEHDSKYAWLTKDPEIMQKYSQDKFCTFSFTVSAMHDLIMLNMQSNRKQWFQNIRKDLPILIISGECDPVGDYGNGVLRVYNGLKNAKVNHVTIRLYDNCRHEILNDSCKEDVIKEILGFLILNINI